MNRLNLLCSSGPYGEGEGKMKRGEIKSEPGENQGPKSN